MKPFFSVVITTYNRAEFLGVALESLLNQTFLDFEVIIVDNFSSDNTQEVVGKFSDLHIKFFMLKNDGNISLSRNFALNKSSGEWIAFLDSDDLWHKNKLQKTYEAINVNLTLIYHQMNIIRNNHVVGKIKTRQLLKPNFEDLLIKGNTIAFSSVTVRKSALELIQGFNCSEHMINAADFNAWLKLARIGAHFAYIPDTLGSYRLHENNLSNSNFLSQAMSAVEEFLKFVDDKKQKKVKALLIYTQAMVYLDKKQYSQSKVHFESILLSDSYIYWIKSRARLFILLFTQRSKEYHFEE